MDKTRRVPFAGQEHKYASMVSQRDKTSRPASPTSSRLGALFLLLLSACVVQPTPAQVQPQVATPQQPTPRIIRLEAGTYLEIRPGMEPGFTHCCGNSDYMIQMDCSDQLMRCYESNDGHWKQTYGKYCKHALRRECYLVTCSLVCEAISLEWSTE